MFPVKLRIPVAVSSGLAAAVLLAACGSSGSQAAGGSSSTPAPTSGKTITATLTEFHIALSSSILTPGTYTFDVKNAGTITHAFTVDGTGVSDKGTSDLAPGKSTTLTVTLKAGKYDVFCPVGNHKMEGMDTSVQVS